MRPSCFIPGKVILTGEHAAVYGKTALAASLSRGVTATITEGSSTDHNALIRKAISLAGGSQKLSISILSDLPVGSGLGSSAAVAAATILTVRNYLDAPITKDELFKLTVECEKIAHGNTSGLDPATVVYQGLVAFRKDQGIEHLSVKESFTILLVNSGKPAESTKEMIERVAHHPQKTQLIDQIGELSLSIKQKLQRGEDVFELLDENGRLLEKLGVVGKSAQALSRALRMLGCSVKITGAGGYTAGSGMMIVLSPDIAKTKTLLDNKHIPYFETVIGV